MSISAALEDYLEAILVIQEKQKSVRVKDLADFMEVKAPSVIDALNNLKQLKLIEQEPYGAVELTPKGMPLAKEIYGRHNTLKKFLHKILDLDESIAEEDACKIEHYLSKQTIQRMLKFISFMEAQTDTSKNKDPLSDFHSFLAKDKG